MTEVWTARQVAEHCGIATRSVRNTMLRLGVEPIPGTYGPGGALCYRADDVRQARAAAPGKGNRTPRKPALPKD